LVKPGIDSHNKEELLSEDMIRNALAPLKDIMSFVSCTHIWGSGPPRIRKGSKIKTIGEPHSGDFNTYFDNQKVKAFFLEEIKNLFNDGKERYFVPEVNKSIYVQSIVKDLRNSAGVDFVELD